MGEIIPITVPVGATAGENCAYCISGLTPKYVAIHIEDYGLYTVGGWYTLEQLSYPCYHGWEGYVGSFYVLIRVNHFGSFIYVDVMVDGIKRFYGNVTTWTHCKAIDAQPIYHNTVTVVELWT
jgi:hypothetical protein